MSTYILYLCNPSELSLRTLERYRSLYPLTRQCLQPVGSAPTFPFLKYDAYTDLNLLYLSTTIMGPRNASYKLKLEYVQIILALARDMRCRTVTRSRRFGGRVGIAICKRGDFRAGVRGL